MTTLTCDLCKNEVETFKSTGSLNFPEGYREVCESCHVLVKEAMDKAELVAAKARDRAFVTAFKQALK